MPHKKTFFYTPTSEVRPFIPSIWTWRKYNVCSSRNEKGRSETISTTLPRDENIPDPTHRKTIYMGPYKKNPLNVLATSHQVRFQNPRHQRSGQKVKKDSTQTQHFNLTPCALLSRMNTLRSGCVVIRQCILK